MTSDFGMQVPVVRPGCDWCMSETVGCIAAKLNKDWRLNYEFEVLTSN